MRPLIAYTTSLNPASASPHQRADDSAQHLDRLATAAMARFWHGISPISLALAYTDWALHLWSSPGSQARLWGKAVQHGADWWADASRVAWRPWGLGPAGLSPGEPKSSAFQAVEQDPRFTAEEWQQWPWIGWAAASEAWEAWWQGASALRGMQPHSREQMAFYGRQLIDLWSPSNWLISNPQAMHAAWTSGGQTLLKGWGQALREWRMEPAAEPAPVASLGPGRGLAMTPGQVVFRNALIELLQYAPATAQVQAEPVLIAPSCIMKYYILDLSPHNSLVRWLVAQGHTVYIVSWRNPDQSDALLGMDDYVRDGVLAALDHVHSATGEPVHLMGYCLGGTFAAIAAAALGGGDAQVGRPARDGGEGTGPLATLSLLAAETDFTEPGEMGVLIDEAQVRLLEDMMAEQGFLTGKQMAGSFQFLHSRELVWSSLTRRWLLGEDEVPNDLMVWNADVTRLPAVMHSQYLRSCFLNNDLAEGRLLFQGQPVSLRDIRVPVFAVGTVKDHVAPWRSVYKVHRLVAGEVTFVLTNGGHNAGIVSEPGHPRRFYQLFTTPPREPWRSADEWQALAPRHEGSWWPAWSAWLVSHGQGRAVTARQPVPDAALGPAPGRYVMVRYGD